VYSIISVDRRMSEQQRSTVDGLLTLFTDGRLAVAKFSELCM